MPPRPSPRPPASPAGRRSASGSFRAAGRGPRLADRRLFNLLPFSRGKTVATETLGSGNPVGRRPGLHAGEVAGDLFRRPRLGLRRRLQQHRQVSVNGVAWQEVQSFYGQPPNAQVFVLREDDEGQTHVTFGDGVNGALLPTGTNNIVATYRYGAGAAAPRRRNADRGADADARPEGRAQPAGADRRSRRRPAVAAALAGAAVGADLQPRRLARRLRSDRADRVRRHPGGRRAMPSTRVAAADGDAVDRRRRNAAAAAAGRARRDRDARPGLIIQPRPPSTVDPQPDLCARPALRRRAVQAGLTTALARSGRRPASRRPTSASASRSTTARSPPPAWPCRACVAIQDVDLRPHGRFTQRSHGAAASSCAASFRSSRWAAPGSVFSPGAGRLLLVPERPAARDPDRSGGVMSDAARRQLRDLLRRQALDPAAGGLPRRWTPTSSARNGPLREMVNRIGATTAVLRRSIDRLWEDQSIETCDDWVIPYIADLLGTRLVLGLDARGQRLDVANTIDYRRRKGTLGAAGADRARHHRLGRQGGGVLPPARPHPPRARSAGRPDRHAAAASSTTLHEAEGLVGPLTRTHIGGFADLRNVYGAGKSRSAFDEFFHTADTRAGEGLFGWHAIPHLGVFVWRLLSLGVGPVTPVAVQGCPGWFTFDPTGRDMPLFAAQRAVDRVRRHLGLAERGPAADADLAGAARRRPRRRPGRARALPGRAAATERDDATAGDGCRPGRDAGRSVRRRRRQPAGGAAAGARALQVHRVLAAAGADGELPLRLPLDDRRRPLRPPRRRRSPSPRRRRLLP